MEKSQSLVGPGRLQEQLTQMQSQVAGAAPIRRRQLAEALEALQEALQEVETAEEELRRQNEELLLAREALETERFRFRELFERAPVGYLVTDESATIRETNPAAVALLNTSRQGLVGKPLTVFLRPSDRGEFRLLLRDMQSWHGTRETEMALVPRDAAARRAYVTVARDETRPGEPIRLRWVLQDISERRAAEEALVESQERLRHSQRLEAIGRLAGGVAHSFNNLLAAIAFHVELILDDHCSDADRKRHALEIQGAGERAAALSRQLLAFSRKQALSPEQISLSDLLLTMEPILRRLVGEDIELELRIDPEAGLVYADRGQLEQVVLNLVVNARDAMPEGGRLTLGTSGVVLEPEDAGEIPPGRYVALTVADDGMGMPPEVLAQLFEPFFTTKGRGRGTGLGLATVYGIVRQSGGDIRVESAPGEGARFTIHLPRVEPSAEHAPQPAIERQRPAPGSEVILLVEDEDNIREPAAEILEAQGYTVLPAADGAKALELARHYADPIHLMITDVVMPNLSGSRLAEALQPSRPDMRVLYISGYPEDAIAHHGVLEPRHRFLQKPFPPGVLLRAVREILDAAEARPLATS